MNSFKLHPRLAADTAFVTDLDLSKLLLLNDSQYPWTLLVPRRPDIKEAHHLSDADQQQLLRESNMLCKVMEELFNPHKLNVAAIGNVVPQLHIHHIARFETDPAWPAPVWGALPAVPYSSDEKEQLVQRIKAAVTSE
jgi:diadenosine tetraphosphate (Ap4A) HIT family hydrolase